MNWEDRFECPQTFSYVPEMWTIHLKEAANRGTIPLEAVTFVAIIR